MTVDMDRITEVLEGMPARFLPRVLQLIREAEESERQVCLKIADEAVQRHSQVLHSEPVSSGHSIGCLKSSAEIAAAIRSRSGAPIADMHTFREAAKAYTEPFDHIRVRPDHEALARERLSQPE